MITISTGGIGPMDITSSAKPKGNSKEEKASAAFASLMNMVSTRQEDTNIAGTSDADVTDVAPSKDVSKDYETYNKQENAEITKDKLGNTDKTVAKEDTETAKTKEVESDAEATEDDVDNVVSLVKEIKETLKETLGITDEQLEKILADMGIDASQLLIGDNLKNFVLMTQGASNVDLLVNEDLSNLVSDISAKVDSLISEFGFNDSFDVQSFISENGELINDMLNESDLNTDIIIDDTAVAFDEQKNDGSVDKTVVGNVEDAEEIVDTQHKTDSKQLDNQETSGFGDESIDKKITVQTSSETGQFSGQEQTPEQATQQVNMNFNQALDNVVNTNVDITSFANGVQEADIIRQIIDQIKVDIGREMQSMEVQLNPENLGKVYVNVEAKDGVMQAKIIAETEAAKNAIENNLAVLKENFSNNEIKVEAIEVMVASYGFFEESQNGDFDNHEQASDSSKAIGNINVNNISEDELTEEEVLEVEMMKSQGNTVSYMV